MSFDKDADLDPRLSSTGAATLLALYEDQYQGFQLIKLMKTQNQDEDARKLVPRIDKAIKAAIADLETLATAVTPDAEEKAAAVDPEAEEEDGDGPSDNKPEASSEALLRELYWRIHDNWQSASAEKRQEAASNLKMVVVSGGTPSWTDLVTLMTEIHTLDQDVGDGDNFPSEWYDDLLERFENKLGKKKPKKKTSAKAEMKIRTPPPDADILEYSAKGTFREGDWVSHPKFGTGIVVESAANVLIEFGPEQKRLAHVPPTAAPSAMPKIKTKTTADTLELARAAGIEIKKIPARIEDEDSPKK